MKAKACSSCKTSNPAYANYCRKCGRPFHEDTKPISSKKCHIDDFSVKPLSNGKFLVEWNAVNADNVMINGCDITGRSSFVIAVKGRETIILRAKNATSFDVKEAYVVYDPYTIYKDRIVEKKSTSLGAVFFLGIFMLLSAVLCYYAYQLEDPNYTGDRYFSDIFGYKSYHGDNGSNEASVDATVDEDVKITGQIEVINVEFNVYEDNVKGMKIHVRFSVQNMKGIKGRCVVYMHYADGIPLKDTNGSYRTTDGQSAFGEDFTPMYDNTIFNDFVIFVPLKELEADKGEHDMKFMCTISEKSSNSITSIACSDYYYFTLTK